MIFKWVQFSSNNGQNQVLPPLRRFVLVVSTHDTQRKELPGGLALNVGTPNSVAVGYLKYAAGDKTCPYFVIIGVGGDATHWCDCLGDDFSTPAWPAKQSDM